MRGPSPVAIAPKHGLVLLLIFGATLALLLADGNRIPGLALASPETQKSSEADALLIPVQEQVREELPGPTETHDERAGALPAVHEHCLVCINEDQREPGTIRIPVLLLETDDPAALYEDCRLYNPDHVVLSLESRRALSAIVDEENDALAALRKTVLSALMDLSTLKHESGEYVLDGTLHPPVRDNLNRFGLEVGGVLESGESILWYANPGDWAPLDVAVEGSWLELERARGRIRRFFAER